MTTICVYCSSSDDVHADYVAAAQQLGDAIARRGDTLVYGGGDIGLMGIVARAVSQGRGRVVGIIPQALYDKEIAYELADELIVTRDMRERKAAMAERADAFVALPGGFGTLEELAEMLTLRQLQLHTKAMILVNTRNFYEPLVAFFEHIYRERFAKPAHELYHVAADIEDALAYLDAYTPFIAPSKWEKLDMES